MRRGRVVAPALLTASLASSCGNSADEHNLARASEGITLGPVNVLTRNYDNARTGANLSETALTTANVNPSSFGKLFRVSVDDQVFAGLLYASTVPVSGTNRNLVFVATVNNSVYAFDADVGGDPVWQKNFNAGARPTSRSEVGSACGGYGDFSGNIGIVGTPVIDGTSGTIYFVTRTEEAGGTVQRLRALDISNGDERAGSPLVITMAVPGTGDGRVGNMVPFNPSTQNQRAALALSQGVVYVAWASFCDTGPYHGWLAGYDATTLAPAGLFNATPTGGLAGIWMAGAAPAFDDAGDLFATTGNGTWDGTSNFGESLLKISPGSLTVSDYFTAGNYVALNDEDEDFGSTGPLLLPGTTKVVSGSKEGQIYVMDATNLGHMVPGDTQITQRFQAVNPLTVVNATHHIHNSAVAWQSPAGLNLYVWGENDYLRGFRFDPASGTFDTTPFASGANLPPNGMPGGMLSLSANGAQAGSGVLWGTTPRVGNANTAVVPGVLRAYNAETLSLLWDSSSDSANDTQDFAKFSPPIVANGRVYVPSFSNSVTVYGLRPTVLTPYTGTPAAIPGTIEVENFDNGGEGIAFHDNEATNFGGAYRAEGVDVEKLAEGDFGIGWTNAGEWLKYSVSIAQTANYTLSARLAAGQSNSALRVEIDGVDVTGTIVVPNSGGFHNWTTLNKSNVALPAGDHVLSVFVVAGGFNLNRVSFALAAPGSCTTAADCNDNNACTVDACNGNACANTAGNAGAVCRAAAGACDAAELCTGSSATCPANDSLPNGSACNDGNAATCADVCNNGTCAGVTCGSGSGAFGGTPVSLPGTVEAEDFDLGGEGVAYHDNDSSNNGGAYRADGVDLQTATEAGFNVGWTNSGEWLKYSVNVAQTANYNVSFRAGSGQSGGAFRLEVDGVDVTGTVLVPNTGGWSTWTTLTKTNVALSSGAHVLRVFVVNSGFNLNYINFLVAASGSCSTSADCNDNNPCTVDACTSNSCSNTVGNAGVVCRASAGACDAVETCTGSSASCPTNASSPNGTACNDGNSLTCGDVCTNGGCAGGTCGSGSGAYGGTPVSLPGTIEAENFDLGGEGIAYHDNETTNYGGAYRSEGVDLQAATEGGYNVGWTNTGEWLKYSVSVAQSANYMLSCRVGSGQSGGSFRIEVDGVDVTGTMVVPNTGGWSNWTTLSKTNIALPAGDHVLRMYVVNGGFNLNSSTFLVAASGSCNTAADCNDSNPCTADTCSGNQCSNTVGNAGVVCRAAASACDASETCTGASATCPVDAAMPNGSGCNDGNPSTCNDVCTGGVCGGGTCGSGSGAYGGTPIALPGTIQAENFDLGGEGVGYHDNESTNFGGAYRNEGVDLEAASEGGYNVGWTNTGEWLKYSVTVTQAGNYTLQCRVAAGQPYGAFRVEVDGADVTGSLVVPNTGGWNSWTSLNKSNIALTAGDHVLRVYVVNGGFNLNSLTFQ